MRSFGGGSRGMGGGSGGGGTNGGGMLRTIHRAVRAGGVSGGGAAHEPFTHGTNTTNTIRTTQTCKNKSNTSSKNSIALSSSTSNNSNSSPLSSHNIPISAASSSTRTWVPSCSSPPYSACDETEWERLEGSDDERGYEDAYYFDNVVFGNVPSRDEVQHAVSALQQVLHPSSFSLIKDQLDYDPEKEGDRVCHPTGCEHTLQSDGPDKDWIEPLVHFPNLKALKPFGTDRVYDAFHLLTNEPSVQRMVISLSTDKAMWDAVMNNEAVREYRESRNQGSADNDSSLSLNEGSDDSAKDILSWIFMNVKAKLVELLEKIMKFATEMFQAPAEKSDTGTDNPMEERLRASFLLSIIVLLVVVVNRANKP